MTVKYTDFYLSGDPGSARTTVEEALRERKFQVSWEDDWSGIAVRGKKGVNIALGAIAQYFKVGITLMSAAPGQTIVRIERLSSGWAGGAIGASRTTRMLAGLTSELESTFARAGVLQRVAGPNQSEAASVQHIRPT
jgi:hypothetical protein